MVDWPLEFAHLSVNLYVTKFMCDEIPTYKFIRDKTSVRKFLRDKIYTRQNYGRLFKDFGKIGQGESLANDYLDFKKQVKAKD